MRATQSKPNEGPSGRKCASITVVGLAPHTAARLAFLCTRASAWQGEPRVVRFSIAVVVAALVLARADAVPSASAATITPQALSALSLADDAAYRTAFIAAEIGAWDRAIQLIATAENPLPAKVLTWMYLADPRSGASFSKIVAFMDANPKWPLADTLRRNAEDALAGETLSPRMLEWFGKNLPRTGAGMVRYAQALKATGRDAEALTWAKRAWTTAALPKDAETGVLAQWGKEFTQADNEQRLDSLLWLQRPNEAKRLVSKIPVGRRALAEARIALITRAPGVDGAVARVPFELTKDPGFVFDRARWRRQNGNIQGAIDLVAPVPAQTAHEDPWWDERAMLARRALESGRITDAYRIAAQHGQTDRADIAEAEWLAGWIALQFLNEPKDALAHFTRQRQQVRLPVSIARAAYWAGRAADKLQDTNAADAWYADAARFGTTYYGQLALEKSGRATLALPPMVVPTDDEATAFLGRELVQVTVLLAALGEDERLRPFLVRLADDAATPSERALVAELANRLDRTDLAVMAGKLAAQEGVLLADAAYPMLTLRSTAGVELALVLGLVRQESEFFATARSSAGALGLMQLMPATARRVATSVQVTYEPSLLTQDPAYNLRLGTAHLADLLDNFRGSYVLALAAYNAGESRARAWIKQYGDPRDPLVDPVDWVEQIPFEETRNYVQRVMENLTVYRHRVAGTATPVTLSKDLRR